MRVRHKYGVQPAHYNELCYLKTDAGNFSPCRRISERITNRHQIFPIEEEDKYISTKIVPAG
jgi:hypothetical protein